LLKANTTTGRRLFSFSIFTTLFHCAISCREETKVRGGEAEESTTIVSYVLHLGDHTHVLVLLAKALEGLCCGAAKGLERSNA
jgi:hypothetical protein